MNGTRLVTSILVFNLVVVVAVIVILVFSGHSLAQPEGAAAGSDSLGIWGVMAAALAVGMGSLGAALAVASVGSAAMGAMSEKPELGGRALIFLGLAEGIAIYGLIVAIMILAKF